MLSKQNNMTQTYSIDGFEALITKQGNLYKVDTTSVFLAERFCNESSVSNVSFFKTIKECKKHVDKLSVSR